MADQSVGALFDESFEFGIRHHGQGDIKQIVGGRPEGSEVAVEEDGMQDGWQWVRWSIGVADWNSTDL